ncbi:cell wall-binding repeat-containing protein [Dehalobacter sp.]|uniref:cell wall-binding repeat-containing protein n=1 Tax=Dehalobacter sp. TaxID=1962289 RepID=UPI0002FA661C|nr:cell wall-binding repeat-containing protein [Dehalobacter sp.]MCG1024831.1 cell wall-binding repeat-containing protein [Dehalobacter sp.]
MFKRKPGALAVLLIVILFLPVYSSGASGAEIQTYQNPSREVVAQKLETISRSKGIPSVLLKTIAYCESGWRQFDQNGEVVTGSTDGTSNPALGIMQVTSYDPGDTEKVNKLKYDIDYNISRGAELLNEKWQMVPKIGDGDRNKLENWYFALWAYHGWLAYNNPNNAAARGEVAYQDAIIRKAATAYFPGIVVPVQITPVPAELLPLGTLPSSSQIWNTPEPYTLGDLTSRTVGTTTRISGQNRIDTVNQIALNGWPSGAQTVILTRSDAFPDALAGVPLAKKYNAPILLTSPDQLDQGVIEVLNTLKPAKVIILGGETAVSKSVETRLKAVLTWTSDVSRIAGADRYQTAVRIAADFPKDASVAIATGLDFPDALSLATAAAANEMPLLLTSTRSLPEVTRQDLSKRSPGKIYIGGGEKVITAEVVTALTQTTGLSAGNIVRFAGSNRYETSVMIAEAFFPSTQEIYMATGLDFADPLAAGALAATKNACLLLISPQGFTTNGPTENYLKKMASSTNVKVIGPEASISEYTVTRVKYLLRQM